ncbi:hypothetical protein [Methylocapsa acidiphila]|uniref:hypothetical protein n=1 Tax=Methylocapsa acidiphila TaxID=133552 RepID=UPI000426EF1D|nr:hypothetical protein [Methylocapsa acidiphila]
MQRRILARIGRLGLVAAVSLGLSACGGRLGNFDQPEPAGSKLSNLLGLGGASSNAPAAGTETRRIFCPEIFVLEGTAASRVYAGAPPSNDNLRYQSSVDDVARECALDGDRISLKIGVAGKVLLGPAGAPGAFNVPVRVAVVREKDNQPLVSKLYRASASVPAGETYAAFTIVTEPLFVPFVQDHAEDDYSIKVGIDEGGGGEKPAGKRDKR